MSGKNLTVTATSKEKAVMCVQRCRNKKKLANEKKRLAARLAAQRYRQKKAEMSAMKTPDRRANANPDESPPAPM
jgi:hypothetical protein